MVLLYILVGCLLGFVVDDVTGSLLGGILGVLGFISIQLDALLKEIRK